MNNVEKWKKEVEKDIKSLKDKLTDMEAKIATVKLSNYENTKEILDAIKGLKREDRSFNRWRGIGLFMLGGISSITLIIIIGILVS